MGSIDCIRWIRRVASGLGDSLISFADSEVDREAREAKGSKEILNDRPALTRCSLTDSHPLTFRQCPIA